MKKQLRLFLAILLVCLGTQMSGFADSVALYVRNRAYAKPIFEQKKTLYAVADDIFPMVQLNMRNQGRVLCGATPDYKGPICPQNTANSFLYIDGKPITHGVLVHHDKPWISIAVLAKAIGYSYQFNRETGIADLFETARVPLFGYSGQSQTPAKESTKGEKPESKPKEKTPKEEETEAPVETQNVSQSMDPNTYEMRAFFDVKNVAKKEVKGVSATLSYLDGYGKPILTRSFNIGTLAPGAVVKESDYWINTTRIYSTKVDVQLDWAGKKKE